MTKNHYNNVIAWTLKNDPAAKTEDTLAGARAIFKNMGVALPNGNMETVASILATNDYMGWRACSAEEAQAAADRGTAAIAVTEDSIHILPAADDTLNSDAAVIHAVDEAAAYYAYSCATTQTKTWAEYANDIVTFAHSFLGMNSNEIEAATDFSLADQWCVDFVRLCCKLAGVYIPGTYTEIIPDRSHVGRMYDWFYENYPSRCHSGTNNIQRGDIAITYKNGNTETKAHACIVDSVNADESINTINGNWEETPEGTIVNEVCFPGQGHVIGWYIHPDYEKANSQA